MQVPSNVTEFRQARYNKYHCYTYSSIFDMESALFFDNVHSIESIVVLFGSTPS